MFYINFADDWIWTADLWHWKRPPLYQLRHNHFLFRLLFTALAPAADSKETWLIWIFIALSFKRGALSITVNLTPRKLAHPSRNAGSLFVKFVLMGGSPGLVVMGRDSHSEVHGFESRHRILDGHFFTYICCKNCNVCLKRPKINEKEARIGPFF